MIKYGEPVDTSIVPDAYHEFEAFDGSSGMVCTRMVMKSGEADQCGLGPELHPMFWVGSGMILVFRNGAPVVYLSARGG